MGIGFGELSQLVIRKRLDSTASLMKIFHTFQGLLGLRCALLVTIASDSLGFLRLDVGFAEKDDGQDRADPHQRLADGLPRTAGDDEMPAQ